MAFTTLICFIIFGYASNYFFQASKVVSTIINTERVYNVYFQLGVEDFYRYAITKDEKNIEKAYQYIDSANEMAFAFSRADSIMENLPRKEWEKLFYNIYIEGFFGKYELAGLMGDKIKLLLAINPEQINKTFSVAHNGYLKGIEIRKLITLYKDNPENFDFADLQLKLDNIHTTYDEFASEMNQIHKFINKITIISIITLIILLGLLTNVLLFLLSRSINEPLKNMIDIFKRMAKGDLNIKINYTAKNEIGELANAFQTIQQGLYDVVTQSTKIAKGDFNTTINQKSDNDVLAISLNKMASQLKKSKTKEEKRNWLNKGLNELNAQMVGDLHVNDLSEKILTFLAQYLNIELATLYGYTEEEKHLFVSSTYGFEKNSIKQEYELGEGIIGQVGKDRKTKIINTPQDYHKIVCSSGEIAPRQIVIIPLIYNNKLRGVLEIAVIEELSKNKLDFLQSVAKNIAVNVRTSIVRYLLLDLLEKTKEQTAELQVQQEELREANEVLEKQTKDLIESEKSLQVQQEELRVSNEELEERTNQLELQKKEIEDNNNKLEEARTTLEKKAQELEQASQYKSEFLANMSHELRTPLNSLLILSKMLGQNKKGNLFEDQVKSLDIIHKSGNSLLQLINEILDLSKIEAGKMSIDLQNVLTDDLRNETLHLFNPLATEKKLDFKVSVDNNFPKTLHTDRQRVMQIIRNLLSNAFKFTKHGSVEVEFSTPKQKNNIRSSDLLSNGACCISVKDSGIGIPENQKEAIFQAFQQADGSISRKYGGTGLGLSISKELSTMLGGEIHLESSEGKGSVFTVYLPINNTPKPASNNQPEQQQISESEPIHTKKEEPETDAQPKEISDSNGVNANEPTQINEPELILIIHPNKTQAEKLLEQCKKRNLQAIIANSVDEGIDITKQNNIIAILISLDPAVHQDIDKLKNSNITQNLPVHVISPFDNETTGGNSNELKTLESLSFDSEFEKILKQINLPSKRILVVEDDQTTRFVIHGLLQEKNISITDAKNGEEALIALRNNPFDFIILDLGLPDFSGKELLERLNKENIKIPKTIIYTGKEIELVEHKELQKYTNSIVIKGVKSDERLMDEVTLFLHQLTNKISKDKSKDKPQPENKLFFKGKKVLIVDDDIRNTFALAQILEDKEIEVTEAENGLVAIDILKEEKNIDLVLMDIMMPEMDGYQAMEEIRKMEEIKEIPIISLSAKAMKEDYDKAIFHGANDYITKPVDEDKLFSLLKIWLYK